MAEAEPNTSGTEIGKPMEGTSMTMPTVNRLDGIALTGGRGTLSEAAF
jgi:hypothetical protein